MRATAPTGPGLLRRLTDAVFPPLCPVSGEETGTHGTLSAGAWAELALLLSGPRCGRCGREVPGARPTPDLTCEPCEAQPRAWGRGAAALRYEGSGRALILSLKHADRLDLVPLLAGWMLRAGPDLVARADLIAPVPMHWSRLLQRRFNQSAELARAVARLGGRRDAYAPTLLRRVRATARQHGHSLAERMENLSGAIAPGRGRSGGAGRMAGRRVLLIDDVLTTGATLACCAAACHRAGAAGVDILVAALVPFEGRAYVAGGQRDQEDADAPY